MFVRKKKTKSGTVKHYLVASVREGGKVRQKVLFYLGSHETAEARLAWLEAEAERLRRPLEVVQQAIWAELGRRLPGRPAEKSPAADISDAECDLLKLGFQDGWRLAREAESLREIIRSAQVGT